LWEIYIAQIVGGSIEPAKPHVPSVDIVGQIKPEKKGKEETTDIVQKLQ
jgi:hypothetical protein